MYTLIVLFSLAVGPDMKFVGETKIKSFKTLAACEIFAERMVPQIVDIEFFVKNSGYYKCEVSK